MQEVQESEQMEERVTRGLALSARKPWFETERDETDDWTGAMFGGRKRIALGDVGDLSRLRTGLGMIGGRVIGIDHDSGSGGGGGGRRGAAVLVRKGRRR